MNNQNRKKRKRKELLLEDQRKHLHKEAKRLKIIKNLLPHLVLRQKTIQKMRSLLSLQSNPRPRLFREESDLKI
jgi:hypothetical protein